MDNANKLQIIQSINKGIDYVKLELINAYQFGYCGQLKQTGRSNKDKEKCGIIVGYKLKNVDTKPLSYLKCEYTIKGIETHKEAANPGEEFIITRDDLKYLMIQNGRKLENANIRLRSGHASKLLSNDDKIREIIRRSNPRQSDGSITTAFYVKHVLMHGTFIDNKFIQRDNLPYIQFKRNSGKSIRQPKYCITISKNIGTNIKLLNNPEIKKYFYWVDDRYLLYKYKKYFRVLSDQELRQIIASQLSDYRDLYTFYEVIDVKYFDGVKDRSIKIYYDPSKWHNGRGSINHAMRGISQEILKEDGNYSISSLGNRWTYYKDIIGQALYGDNNVENHKYYKASLVHRNQLHHCELGHTLNSKEDVSNVSVYLYYELRDYISRCVEFQSIQIIANLSKEEFVRQSNKYDLAGYEQIRCSRPKVEMYIKRYNDYKYSVAVLQTEQVGVKALQSVLNKCSRVGTLELRNCTVRLNSLRKTFGSMPNKIGTLYIDKVSIPGGITMYSSKNVKNPGNKVIDFIVNDDKLKKIAARQGYDPKDRYDFAIDSIINDAFTEVKIKFNNISDRQLYIIRNMLRCGIFDSKVFDLVAQLNLIDEIDAIEIYKSGAMRVLEDCSYKISLYTVSQMFDNLGKKTKVITTNKYVEVANKRRLQLKK